MICGLRNNYLYQNHMQNVFCKTVMGLQRYLPFHVASVNVPHSGSGVVPMSSLLGVGQLGFWELERVEQLGEGWGK